MLGHFQVATSPTDSSYRTSPSGSGSSAHDHPGLGEGRRPPPSGWCCAPATGSDTGGPDAGGSCAHALWRSPEDSGLPDRSALDPTLSGGGRDTRPAPGGAPSRTLPQPQFEFRRLTCLVDHLRRGPYGLEYLEGPPWCTGLIRIRAGYGLAVTKPYWSLAEGPFTYTQGWFSGRT